MKLYEIPKTGAMIFQGRVNGLSIKDVGNIISEEPVPADTLKYHIKVANRALGTAVAKHGGGRLHDNATNRSIGMMLAAGLMQHKDLQKPGDDFVFSIEPGSDCAMQWDESRLPQFPLVRVPLRGGAKVAGTAKGAGEVWLDASVRSHLSAVLLGMGHDRIEAEGISLHDRWQVNSIAAEAGLTSILQLAAHCFVNEAIELPEAFLTAEPSDDIQPIEYVRPATLHLPLGPEVPPILSGS